MEEIQNSIIEGKTALGIELGSTRIKAVLIDESRTPIASGSFDWENRLEDGFWTYSLDMIHRGLQGCYADLCRNVQKTYGLPIKKTGSIGIGAMMHGYMTFDAEGHLLVPFRTWRNTTTERSAAELTERFGFNIPQRWSIAHLYQALLNKESHCKDIAFLTTLAGYIHKRLTGKAVLGAGDASGMFPLQAQSRYDEGMTACFEKLAADKGLTRPLGRILPEPLPAGAEAGRLTEEGARFLDPSGSLEAGIPLCPPEGDAGTGMTATNSVAPLTGNVSAGTSIFAMIVLEKPLSAVYPEIDIVATPDGSPVAMVHCNNCTSDLDAWIGLFRDFALIAGSDLAKSEIYDLLYGEALRADPDCGGLLSYNYISGEPITGLEAGLPLFTRESNARLTLANFMRTQLYSAIATLKIGLDILIGKEHIAISQLAGHGGLFKTPLVGQRMMAAMGVPVSVTQTAGEGGAWGIALLADYLVHGGGEPLSRYLLDQVFADTKSSVCTPEAKDAEGFAIFMERYKRALPAERALVECLHGGDRR